jgi:hypothetical protein
MYAYQHPDAGWWGDSLPDQPTLTLVPGGMAPARPTDPQAVMPTPKAIAWVKMAPDLLRAMAHAATHAGRSAGEVWAEAAREWLLKKSLETEYDVLANQPDRRKGADPLAQARSRMWGSIDTAMADIRQQPYIR